MYNRFRCNLLKASLVSDIKWIIHLITLIHLIELNCFAIFVQQIDTPLQECIMLNKLFVNEETHALKNDKEYVAQGRSTSLFQFIFF